MSRQQAMSGASPTLLKKETAIKADDVPVDKIQKQPS